ncbi:MAG: hypothetical protein ABI359_11100 [Ginsengibacter sp.]
MDKTIIASEIRRKYKLIPQPGKRCYIIIDNTQRIEMIWKRGNGVTNGFVWLFVCPVTGKLSRKLRFINGTYINTKLIKDYYRKNKPDWHSGTKMDKVLMIKQHAINAEKEVNQRFFKTHYNGKPTKRYLKCLQRIEAAKDISMKDIINGKYDLPTKNHIKF